MSVPTIKYAKPRSKVPVNEQGVPIRQKPLPSKPKAKVPQSVKYPSMGSEVPTEEPATPPEEPQGDTPYAGTYQPVPERPFADLQEETFPVGELFGGGDPSSLLEMDQGGMHFAQALEDMGRYGPGRAGRAAQIIQTAQYMHGNGNTQRIHTQDNVKTDIPVGHVRVMPLIPTAPNIAHVVKVHYPQGRVTTYRARLNDDDTGYR